MLRATRFLTRSLATNVIVLGAAGRDFHNFNTFFRDNEEYNVVAFTAAQIPDIADRNYPASLAGKLYPEGIPILAEEDLTQLIHDFEAEVCVFSYSDTPHDFVMNLGSQVLAEGANYMFLSPEYTTIESKKNVISVCAVRTGCGKSQVSRRVIESLQAHGEAGVVVRHPMPYDPDLEKVMCQRFASMQDFVDQGSTFEEMEEGEGHIAAGSVVYMGVDFQHILNEAENEGTNFVIWDGGNNDTPFYRCEDPERNLHICIVDVLRPGHETTYHPGETNLRMADVVIVNKMNSLENPEDLEIIEKNIAELNPSAIVVHANSPCRADDEAGLKGKKVLVVEDGPTLTHGDMKIGAGIVVAERCGCEIVDPRPYAVGSIKDVFESYSHLDRVLPAMGYGEAQMKELEETIANVPCDAVIVGTPIDLGNYINIEQPSHRVYYDLEEIDVTLFDIIKERFGL